MSKVFVIDTNKQPLTPVHPGRARRLLTQGKAAVFRRYPFTIVLKEEIVHPKQESLRIKLDPGSKTTGIALVSDATGEVIFGAELAHRGDTIKKRLDDRRAVRRSRRHRETRYRQARFDNRRRQEGWLPPSLERRINNILTWVQLLSKMGPVNAISMERVRFDTQLMHHPERAGTQYQQGTLQGYEVREYLLEKWQRTCAYCGKQNVPLQVEHIHPRSKGKDASSGKGFRTGDLVEACVTTGKKAGTYVGRVAVRASGSFNVTTATQMLQGINHRFCRTIQRADGYRYAKGVRHSSHA